MARRAHRACAQRMGRAVALRAVLFEAPEKKVKEKWMGARECGDREWRPGGKPESQRKNLLGLERIHSTAGSGKPPG